jgi:hypothetical protein
MCRQNRLRTFLAYFFINESKQTFWVAIYPLNSRFTEKNYNIYTQKKNFQKKTRNREIPILCLKESQ